MISKSQLQSVAILQGSTHPRAKNRAEAARERLESSHYGPAGAQIPHNPYRPQDRLRSPYLDPHSASARSRRASVNAGLEL